MDILKNIHIPGEVVGLEIDSSSLRWVELQQGFSGGIDLSTYHVEALATEDDTDTLQRLAYIFTANNLQDKSIVTTIPETLATFRFISLPFTHNRKIDKVIGYEIERLLPFSPQEVLIDYILLDSQEGKSNILAVIVKKETIKKHLDTLALYGITPEIVTVKSLPLLNLLKSKEILEGNLILLDIEEEHISILIIKEGVLKIIRAIPYPIGQLEKGDTLNKLISEIKRGITRFKKEEEADIEKIIVYQGENRIDIEPKIKDILAIETIRGNDLKEIGIYINPNYEYIPPTLIGAALSGLSKSFYTINLRKGELAKKRNIGGIKGILKNITIIFSVILLLSLSNLYYKKWSLESYHSNLKKREEKLFLEALPGTKKIVNAKLQLQQKLDELNGKYGLLGSRGNSTSPLTYLLHITDNFPKDGQSAIYRYSYSGNNIKIEGEAGSFESIDRIKGELIKVEGIEKIKVTETKLTADQKRVKFKMNLFVVGRD